MLPKPKKHCACGSYEHVVPMACRNHRVEYVDYCVAQVVAALNAANVPTTWSCCGHGETDGVVALDDGRYLVIMKDRKRFEEWELDTKREEP